ncbi:MAG: hypothetical protein AAGD04_00125 [Pseudomonadota bacterium]
MRLLILILCSIWAGPTYADFAKLSGPEIAQTLADSTLQYETAKQRFYASGKTLYESSEDSWGNWAVREDRYCSQWPPGETWDCYDVLKDGAQIRFLDDYGNASDGTRLP